MIWKVGRGRRLAAAVVVTLVASPVVGEIHTGSIEAVARQADGAPVVGAEIRLERVETGLVRGAATGADGLVRFSALPPGSYRVGLEPPAGGSPAEEVRLQVGQIVRVELVLRLVEGLQVTAAAPIVQPLELDSSTNIVPEQVDALPVANRDFRELAFVAPGVERERGEFRFISGGPVIGAAGNASQATILVDGLDFTDPSLGLSRVALSQEAVREFRVVAHRFDSEVGGSAGGGLSIVTRSGTNRFSGRLFLFARDDALQERGLGEEDDLPFGRNQIGGSVGGAIEKDTTHFFVAGERIDVDDVVAFRPRGGFAALARDLEHPVRQDLLFSSLDHRLGAGGSLSGKLVWERYREENFRVGGVADPSYGQRLDRDNWNVAALYSQIIGADSLNELRFQYGSFRFREPPNSLRTTEWFSSGTTLRTGTNLTGDLLGEGDSAELRETFHRRFGRHHLKFGGSVERVDSRSRIDAFQEGFFTYLTDDRTLPISYFFGEGSSEVSHVTTRYGVFVQDDWRPSADLALKLGVRYDLDTEGNNPGFKHPLVPDGRPRDENNLQPRLAFAWDLGRAGGRGILRGGVGRFIGRYLLVPVGIELQQNGVTGRLIRRNVNGRLLGLPPPFWLDPANPETTGIPLPPDISLIDRRLEAPSSMQATLGWSRELLASGLTFDLEAIYVEGDDEIVVRDTNFGGNQSPLRPNPAYSQINTYTNEGRSRYRGLVIGVHGSLPGGHLLAASATVSRKENLADDFSPAFPFGFPSDPADIEAEWGHSRSDESLRIVASGVFRLPWRLTLAPIVEYGSGQPWTRRLGYDFNGDGKNSDRRPGARRNGEDGPEFRQVSLRLMREIRLPRGRLELIAEAFNLFNETNLDVRTIDGAELLLGPTLADPTLPEVPNPAFGTYAASLPKREIQLGVRWSF